MEKKKILIINTVPYSVNGISKVIENYYRALNLNKYQIDFIVDTVIEDAFLQLFKRNNAKVTVVFRKQSPLKYFFDLIRIVRTEKYNIVHVHGNSCTTAIELLAAKIGGCKKRIAHSHSTSCDHLKVHKLLRPILEFSVTDRLACSQDAGKWLFHEKKFMVLPNAFEMERFTFNTKDRSSYRKKLNIHDDCVLIGHIGAFNGTKNQRYLIDLISSLSEKIEDTKLLLIGEGDNAEAEKKYVNEKHMWDKVIFYGVSKNISGMLSAMDVFALPSKHEGLGIVLLEAQINGLPCVASDVVPQEVSVGNDVTFLPLNQPEMWTAKIQELYENGITKVQSRVSESRYFASYDIKNAVKMLETIYDQI